MREPATSFPVLVQFPLFRCAAGQPISPRTLISQNEVHAAVRQRKQNPFPKHPILNRNTASIPSAICLILKGRKSPNPGKNTFHTFEQRCLAGDTRSDPNPHPSPESRAGISSRTSASIPSAICLILKDRKSPNPGKNTFHAFEQRYPAGDTECDPNPCPSPKSGAGIPSRTSASIPPPMCLILKDGKSPNPGKLRFTIHPKGGPFLTPQIPHANFDFCPEK